MRFWGWVVTWHEYGYNEGKSTKTVSKIQCRVEEQGALKMVIGGKEAVLQKKQSISFGADVPRAYQITSDEVCTVCNVIFYPKN